MLYFETGDLSMFDSTFLFSEREHTYARAQLIRFDTQLFASEYRDKVMLSLQRGSDRDMRELPL